MFEVTEDKLSSLIDQGFKVPVIAQLLGVSSRTIERRMSTCGLSIAGEKTRLAPTMGVPSFF